MTQLVSVLNVPRPQERYDLFVGASLRTLTVDHVEPVPRGRHGLAVVVFTDCTALQWDNQIGFFYR